MVFSRSNLWSKCLNGLCLLALLLPSVGVAAESRPAAPNALPIITGMSRWNLEPVGYLGSPIWAVASSGHVLYQSRDREIVAFNTTNPLDPQPIGSLELPSSSANLLLAGNRLFAASLFPASLYVIDVTDPAQMQILGQLPLPMTIGQACTSLSYANNLLAIGFRDSPFAGPVYLLDVSNPAAPQLLKEIRLVHGIETTPQSVLLDGNRLYISWGDYDVSVFKVHLQVLSIANPIAPVELGYKLFFNGFTETDLAKWGPDIFIGYHQMDSSAVARLEVSDPRDLRLTNVFTYTGGDGKPDLQFSGTDLYIAYSNLIFYLDAAQPTSLKIVGQAISPVYEWSQILPQAAVNDDGVYLARGEGGAWLTRRDLSDSRLISLVSNPSGIEVFEREGRAYALMGGNHISIADVSEPDQPKEIGRLEQKIYAFQALVAGNLGFLIGYDYIQVISMDNLTAPTLRGSLWVSFSEAHQAAIQDHYLYLPSLRQDGLSVIDFSDPDHLVAVSNVPAVRAWAVAVRASVAYLVADGFLKVLDVHDPVHPQLINQIALPYDFLESNIVLSPDSESGQLYAYISMRFGENGLAIVNVSDPAHLTLTHWVFPDHPYYAKLGIDEGLLVVDATYFEDDGTQTLGMFLYSLRTPTRPRETARYFIPRGTYNQAVVRNRIAYLTAGTSHWLSDYWLRDGLNILKAAAPVSTSRIVQANGLPFTSATVTVQSSLGASASTDGQGKFSFDPVPLESDITFTPTQQTKAFYPPQTTLLSNGWHNQLEFTALPPTQTVPLPAGNTQPIVLSFNDTQGLATTLTLTPTGITQTLQLQLTPMVVPPPVGLAFAGHAFTLEVLNGGKPLSDYSFSQPAQLEIVTSAYDLGAIVPQNGQVYPSLYKRNGSAWELVAGSQSFDPTTRTLTAYIPGDGLYALFGPTLPNFLPLITPWY